MIQRACARAGFVPRVVARATDFAVLLSLVAAGAGLTLVPDLDALTEAAQDLPAAA
jgi:DNA-binding transcriptional LysR family regulator